MKKVETEEKVTLPGFLNKRAENCRKHTPTKIPPCCKDRHEVKQLIVIADGMENMNILSAFMRCHILFMRGMDKKECERLIKECKKEVSSNF